MRILFLTLALALAAVFPRVSIEGAAGQFVSRSSELVVLPVTVTDRKGGFVSDIPRERFTVYDNGRAQPIELFSNEDTPVTVGLVIDNSGSMRRRHGEVVAATLAFARASHPQDEIFTIEFNDTVRNPLEGRPLFALDTPRLEKALLSMVPEGRTALYDALMTAMDNVDRGSRPRKVIVLMSDGGDNTSRATLRAVLDRARRSNITIYAIGLFRRDDPDANPGVLKNLAEATGGERFLPQSASPLLLACIRIAREIRSGYTLGYVPPARDGAYHRIRVVVAPTDTRRVNVRTRPGYFAAADASAQAGASHEK